MNFQQWIRPIPKTALFQLPDHHVWCGSLTEGPEGTFHLFYSRWPKSVGFEAWVTHSEVARAVSDSSFGPWHHEEVILPARETHYWDANCTHNPTLVKWGPKYHLFYMGNRGNGDWFEHRNHQRIGLATAHHPAGPWNRGNQPLILPQENFHDSLMCSNPSVTPRPEGGFLMIYKGVGTKKPLPFGGPVVHIAALADSMEGPYQKQPLAVFTAKGSDFAAEDPFIWIQGKTYYALVKDMQGSFTNQGPSLALFSSPDGLEWKPSPFPLASDLRLRWEDETAHAVKRLERPQLFLTKGIPRVLCCAVLFENGETGNVQIPLQSD